MKGKIFGDIGVLKIQVGGKIWVFDRMTKTELRFKPAPLGGYAGSGNYLKNWRKRKGHTQKDAAEMFGVSQSFINKIERGIKPIPKKIMEKLTYDNYMTSHGKEQST